MIRRLVPRGLRGRLLAAFVLTSAVTLVVAAAVMLSPLRDRLREQSIDTLRAGVTDLRPQFDRAVSRPVSDRFGAVVDAANALQDRANARVLVDALDDERYFPDFYYDSEFSSSSEDATEIALRALREDSDQISVEGDRVIIADVLRVAGAQRGVLVAQRRLTEVTTAVDQVRNALLAAAAIGLLVAVAARHHPVEHAAATPRAAARRGAADQRRGPGRSRAEERAATRSATSPARWRGCRRSCAARRPRGARSSPPPRTSCARR